MSAPRRYTGQAGLLYRRLVPIAKNLALKAWSRLPVSVRVSGPANKLRRLLQSRNVIFPLHRQLGMCLNCVSYGTWNSLMSS